MKKIPIDEAPAGMWLDLAAAEAMGYIRVSIEQAKKTPTELLDIPVTEERYVYVFVDDWEDHNSAEGVWRRRHGAGDFRMWQPSTNLVAAMDLIEDRKRCDFNDTYAISMNYIFTEGMDICTAEWQVELAGSTSDEFCYAMEEVGELPLAICRAYLRAKGVECVEVTSEGANLE